MPPLLGVVIDCDLEIIDENTLEVRVYSLYKVTRLARLVPVMPGFLSPSEKETAQSVFDSFVTSIWQL